MPRLLSPLPSAAETSTTKAGWRPKQWAADSGMGLSSVWDLIAADELEVVRFGASMTIILTSPAAFLARKAEEMRELGKDLPKIVRPRGRPHKNPAVHAWRRGSTGGCNDAPPSEPPAKRPRGRPRKIQPVADGAEQRAG